MASLTCQQAGHGRTRKTEQARLQGEVDRARRVVDAIDAAGNAGTGPAGGE